MFYFILVTQTKDNSYTLHNIDDLIFISKLLVNTDISTICFALQNFSICYHYCHFISVKVELDYSYIQLGLFMIFFFIIFVILCFMAYVFLQPSNNDNLENMKRLGSGHYVSKEEYILYYTILGDIENEIEDYYLKQASSTSHTNHTNSFEYDVCDIIHRNLRLQENELMKLSKYGRRKLRIDLWQFADRQKEEFLEQQKKQKQRLQEIKNAKYIQSITSSLQNGSGIREASKSQNQSLTNLSNGSTKSPIDFLDVVIANAVLNDDDENSNQCKTTVSEVIETARHYNDENLDCEKSYSSSNCSYSSHSSSSNSSSYQFSDDSSSSSSSSSDDNSSSYYSSSSSSDSSYY